MPHHRRRTVNARETLATYGSRHLSVLECLSLLLSSETQALAILRSLGGAPELLVTDAAALRAAGATAREAERILAAVQLSASLTPSRMGQAVRSGACVAALLRPIIRGVTQEHFLAVGLDSRHRVRFVETAHVGTVDSSPFHPACVLRRAVRDGSSAIVIAHNHPSGDPTPSAEDRQVTERMRAAADVLGIRMLDHLVLGSGCFYSSAEEGFFPYP